MDKLDEVMQVTSLWNVLRTASAWVSMVTIRSSRLPRSKLVFVQAPDGVASITSPMRNNATEVSPSPNVIR